MEIKCLVIMFYLFYAFIFLFFLIIFICFHLLYLLSIYYILLVSYYCTYDPRYLLYVVHSIFFPLLSVMFVFSPSASKTFPFPRKRGKECNDPKVHSAGCALTKHRNKSRSKLRESGRHLNKVGCPYVETGAFCLPGVAAICDTWRGVKPCATFACLRWPPR